MKAFFVRVNSKLSDQDLSNRRRKLRERLRQHGIELQAVRTRNDAHQIVTSLATQALGSPVVVLDERHAHPDESSWLADFTGKVLDFTEPRRPQVVYVSCHTTKSGIVQMMARHPIVSAYIERDGGTRWVDSAAAAVINLAEQLKPIRRPKPLPVPSVTPEIVGESPCFRDAVEELDRIVRSPYGFVTGEQGAGKLFLIRTLWRQHNGDDAKLIVLPCGSFFKDYYVAGSRRRIGGGREAVDQLTPYIMESRDGLLVLHHLEQLPTAVQEELDVRLSMASENKDGSMRLVGLDSSGPVDYDLHLVATSTSSSEELEQTGRVIPDLVSKLRRRHVRIPSLAERGPEDVELVCGDMLQRISSRQGLPTAPKLSEAAHKALTRTFWPNNLSDLLRALEHAVSHCRGKMIRREDLPKGMVAAMSCPRSPSLDEILEQAERTAIEDALRQTNSNVTEAARILGRNRGTLSRRMKRLGIKLR